MGKVNSLTVKKKFKNIYVQINVFIMLFNILRIVFYS